MSLKEKWIMFWRDIKRLTVDSGGHVHIVITGKMCPDSFVTFRRSERPEKTGRLDGKVLHLKSSSRSLNGNIS